MTSDTSVVGVVVGSWKWILAFGIVLILVGILAIANPLATMITTSLLLAIGVLFAGNRLAGRWPDWKEYLRAPRRYIIPHPRTDRLLHGLRLACRRRALHRVRDARTAERALPEERASGVVDTPRDCRRIDRPLGAVDAAGDGAARTRLRCQYQLNHPWCVPERDRHSDEGFCDIMIHSFQRRVFS